MLSPIPVVLKLSLLRTACLYASLSFNLPVASIKSTSLSIASDLFSTLGFNAIPFFFNKSVIFIYLPP